MAATRKIVGILRGTHVSLNLNTLLVFLNAYRNNPQAHGITVVAFYPKVFRVSYFHEE
jgi:hypothetical protein